MLIKGTDIIGKKVITINEGKEIEDIDDIIYDPKDNRVRALLVDPGNMFSEAKVILIEDARVIGKDAVIIESSDVLKNVSEITEPLAEIANSNTFLTNNKIISENGSNLGKVTDIYFDSETGQVMELEASQGLSDVASGKKRVKIDQIITVGEDAIIVKSIAEKDFEEQAKTQGVTGAITKGTEQIKDETPRYLERARDTGMRLTEQLQQKAKDIGESPEVGSALKKGRGYGKRMGNQLETEVHFSKDRAQEFMGQAGAKGGKVVKRGKTQAKKIQRKASKT